LLILIERQPYCCDFDCSGQGYTQALRGALEPHVSVEHR
jgi:hypothetical protein